LFDLTVVARDGGTTTLADQDCQYLYPHEVIGNSLAAGAIIDELQRRLARGQDVTRLAPRFYQRNGLYAFYDSAALAGLLGARGAAEMAVLAAHGATAYAYFAYSTSVWDALNDTTAQLRPGMRLLRGGLQMAAQHMPQGDEITIPLTSNIGYQKQVLVVVHFADAEPDLGRKGFQPELRHAAEVASVAIVNLLKKQRRFLKADSGAGAQILQQGDLHKWITDQERHEATAPMELSHPEFFVPINRIAITAAPQSEQDVIVLFNQLLAGGVIRGIRVLATSQHEQYDGVFRYVVEEPIAHHEFDEALNPLGVEVGKYQSPYRSRPYVLEYKFSVDGLVHEFESGDKHEGNVNLVVAWRMDQEWRQRYEVTSLLDLRHLSAREFHGQTHVFRDSASGDIRFYGVILSELIDYLNNVHGVQAAQATTYDETEH
jgi:hypothetical protein